MSASFGATLRQLREARALSLGDLARSMGVTTVYLSRVELGKSTPLTFARTVEAAQQLAVEPAVLLHVHPTLGPAFAAGEDAERAAVLEFLRNDMVGYCDCCGQAMSDLAYHIDIIERGEHRREVKP